MSQWDREQRDSAPTATVDYRQEQVSQRKKKKICLQDRCIRGILTAVFREVSAQHLHLSKNI